MSLPLSTSSALPKELFSPNFKIKSFSFFWFLAPMALMAFTADAQVLPKLSVEFNKAGDPGDIAVTLQLVAMLTILSLAPSILIMMTCFTRIAVVLGFLRQAMGTQNAPPNQMLMGLSLFLTFFVMHPTLTRMNDDGLQPYLKKQINYQEGIERGMKPLREFMMRQVNEKDLALMVRLSRLPSPRTPDDIAISTLIPAFCLSELRAAFIIGFLIYLPFLIIDMVVASVLMSMGMMMLPPMMISTPFKLILFVLVDGWNLVIHQLVLSFR
jgi:flagellar biosynthesis protein FliP